MSNSFATEYAEDTESSLDFRAPARIGGLLPFGILMLAASPLVATKLRGPAR